jgi:hypothetical protein
VLPKALQARRGMEITDLRNDPHEKTVPAADEHHQTPRTLT